MLILNAFLLRWFTVLFFSLKALFLEFSNYSNSTASRSYVRCFINFVILQCPISIPITDSFSRGNQVLTSNYFTPKLRSILSVLGNLPVSVLSPWGSWFYSILPGATLTLVWRFQPLVMLSPAVLNHPVSLKSPISWTIPAVQVITLSSLTFPPALFKISTALKQPYKTNSSWSQERLGNKMHTPPVRDWIRTH